MFYLANYIEKLGGKKDEKYIRKLLGHIALMQEEIGTGGGGFRFLYAAFLAEAYERMELPVLREAYRKMNEAAGSICPISQISSGRQAKQRKKST